MMGIFITFGFAEKADLYDVKGILPRDIVDGRL